MSDLVELLNQRINQLLRVGPRSMGTRGVGHVYMGTLNIATTLYGPNSPQVQTLREMQSGFPRYVGSDTQLSRLVAELKGILESFQEEIQAGLVVSLQGEARGEILADFISMARQALADDEKDVAAVLACAALEDTLKRFAESHGLDVYDKDMSAVIGALQSAGLAKGPRGKLLRSFVTVRNNAFHARWDKIDSTEIQSIIAFVKEFLIKEFSAAI